MNRLHKFTVLYGKILGEMLYAGSLGYLRMFFVDKNGYIVKILPKEYFMDTSGSYKEISGMIKDYDR